MKQVFYWCLFLFGLLSSFTAAAIVPDSLSLHEEMLDMYFYVRENPDSVMKRARRLLADEELEGVFRGNMHEILGDGYYMKSQYDSGIYHLEKAELIFEEYGGPADLAWNKNYQGNIYMEVGQSAEAIKLYSEAACLFERELDDPWGYSTILYNLALLQLDDGELAAGIELARKASRILIEIDSAGLPSVFGILSEFHAELGNLDSAYYYSTAALELNEKYQTGKLEKAALLNGLAYIAFLEETYQKSLDFADSALVLSRTVGDKAGLAYAYLGKALAYEALDLNEKGTLALDSAWYFARKNRSPSIVRYLIEEEMELYSRQADWKMAYLMSDSLNDYTDRFEAMPLRILFLEEELRREAALRKELHKRENSTTARLKLGRIILLIIVLAGGILAYFFVVSNRNRKKLLRFADILKSKNGTLKVQYQLLNEQLEHLESSQAQIMEDAKLRDRLVALISHDLRTPLTQVKMVADLVEDPKTPEAEKNELIKA